MRYLLMPRLLCRALGLTTVATPLPHCVDVFVWTCSSGRAGGLVAAYKRLLRHPMFLVVCSISLVVTAVRETFNTFTAAYLEVSGGNIAKLWVTGPHDVLLRRLGVLCSTWAQARAAPLRSVPCYH